MPADPDARPLARMRTPGELAAVVPSFCGFVPHESLVALSLHEPRGRLGLTMRFDLPPPDREVFDHLAALVVERVHADGGTRVAFVVWSDAPDPVADVLPHADLVGLLVAEANDADLDVTEALLVRDGRWHSFTCHEACCPRIGTPLPDSGTSLVVGLVESAHAYAGRVVLASRAELVASIAPQLPLGADLARARLLAEEAELMAGYDDAGSAAVRVTLLGEWHAAWTATEDPRRRLDDVSAARLVASLGDIHVRDLVLCEAVTAREPLLHLLTALCRSSLPPFDAPVCTALAWVAYLGGDGALANVALDRALEDDPAYSAARLLRDALARTAPPELVRAALVESRGATRRGAGLGP